MTLTPDPPVATISQAENRVLAAFLRDGADFLTVARRCELNYETVKSHMKSIHVKVDRVYPHLHTGPALVVALLSGRVKIKVCRHPQSHGRPLHDCSTPYPA